MSLCALLLFCLPTFAQNVRWDAVSTTTTGTGQMLPVLALPGAQVNFFTGCTVLPCTTPAVTYQSATSTTACPSTAQVVWQLPTATGCVATTDSQGNFGGWFAPGAYQYVIQVSGITAGPYYFNVGAGSGGASSPPQYSVQFALNSSGGFGSDPAITINPTAHSLTVAGSGTGLFGLTAASSGNTFFQTVQSGNTGWYWYWPIGPPTGPQQCMMGTTTGLGSFRYCSGGMDPTLFTGTDIGIQTNNAIQGCLQTAYGTTSACEIHVPPGPYTYATTIQVPLNTFGGLKLVFDAGAWLHYTGTGDAIKGYIGANGPNTVGTIIEGGSIWGDVSGTGANGVHLLPGNQMTVRDMQIVDFTTGVGLLLEGPNRVNVSNNVLQDNKIGMRLIPTFCTGPYPYTCSGSTSGTAYTVNNLIATNNAITNNLSLGIEDDRNSVSGGTTGTLNNTYDGNDLELNGNTCTGGGICGAIYIDKSTGTNITHSYFEGSSRQIIIGENTATNYFGCAGCNVKDNYFTIRTATTYLVEAINTYNLSIDGNSTVVSTENSSNCAYNETAYNSGVSYGAQSTFWGRNQIVLTGGGNLFCVGGAVEQLMAGAGSYAAQDANYQPILAYQNFAANGAVTSETVSIQYVSSESSCYATPRTANAAGVAQWIDTYGSGGFTFHHPATASMDFDLWCAWKAPPE
jgi:hypothetical protein